MFVFRLALVYG